LGQCSRPSEGRVIGTYRVGIAAEPGLPEIERDLRITRG
jgi:hypothetical protein